MRQALKGADDSAKRKVAMDRYEALGKQLADLEKQHDAIGPVMEPWRPVEVGGGQVSVEMNTRSSPPDASD